MRALLVMIEMKITIVVFLAVLGLTSQVMGLTRLITITSPKGCPEHLRINVQPIEGSQDQYQVDWVHTPMQHASHQDRVRMHGNLRVIQAGQLLASVPVRVSQKEGAMQGTFKLHRQAFESSRLILSTYLEDSHGIAMVGGGVVMEITLKGFLKKAP